MSTMFGTRYAVLKGSSSLDTLVKEKIVVSAKIESAWCADNHVVCAKHVNKSRVERIAKALSTLDGNGK